MGRLRALSSWKRRSRHAGRRCWRATRHGRAWQRMAEDGRRLRQRQRQGSQVLARAVRLARLILLHALRACLQARCRKGESRATAVSSSNQPAAAQLAWSHS